MSAPDPIAVAKNSAAHDGCDCESLVELTELAPGITIANVRHDHRCQLLTRQARGGN